MKQIEQIQHRCAQEYGITREQLLSKSRTKRLVNARHLAMYISRELTELSFENIAFAFDREDNTTVISACKKVGFLRSMGKSFSKQYRNVKEDLSGSEVTSMAGTG